MFSSLEPRGLFGVENGIGLGVEKEAYIGVYWCICVVWQYGYT